MENIDAGTLIRQIGGWQVMAISGGRWQVDNRTSVVFPVSRGIVVRVRLTVADTYTVTRERTVLHGPQKGAVIIQYHLDDVYAEEISEVAYRASLKQSLRSPRTEIRE